MTKDDCAQGQSRPAQNLDEVGQLTGVGAHGHKRILLVDDDADVRDIVVRQLQTLGYTVTEAISGESGLAAIAGEAVPFDLVLTDMVMPGTLNGKQLADEILRRWPHMKVAFMSGYTADAIMHDGRVDSGVRLLSKPFRRADLARFVREVLDETSSP